MRIERLGIVGVGLIGGSIALAARARGLADFIIGCGRSPDSLHKAHELGMLDASTTSLADLAEQAEFIVFCTPVDRIAEQVLAIAPHCRPGTILTDAGSTKAEIIRAVVGRLPSKVVFVGSHPIAGSEKSGPEHARGDLFLERWTVITPTDDVPSEVVGRVETFWQVLGSRVARLSADEHDQALALTSHLPHLLASALAGILPNEFRRFAATGFRDTTRIAAGEPDLWTAIFRANRTHLAASLAKVSSRLREFADALHADDAQTLHRLLRHGKEIRDALGTMGGRRTAPDQQQRGT